MATISSAQLHSISAGIATALSNLQARIEDRVLAETLPIAGNRLQQAAQFGQTALTATEDMGAALAARLTQLANQGTQTDTAVIAALQSHLAGLGYAGVVVGLTVVGGTVSITLGASHTETYVQDLNGDLGFGGIALEADGTAEVEAAFTYDLEFGTSAPGGFFFDAGGAEEVSLSLTIDNVDLGNTVSIGGLDFEASDAGSSFSGDIAINVAGLGALTAAELATATLTSTLSGGADVAIEVAMTQGEFVPALSAVFDIDWNFNSAAINPDNTNANFGQRPVVVFRDVTMDLGGFMENFVAPVVTQLKDLLEPLQPIVEILNGNIRLLSDFPGVGSLFDADGDGDVTLIDLIDLVSDVDTAPIQAVADLIEDVANWVDILDGLGLDEGNLVLGDIDIEGNIRDAGFTLSDAVASMESINDNLESVLAGLSGAGWDGGGRDILESITGGGIFQLPFLSDPSDLISLLLGGDADLLKVDLPEINLGTGGPVTFLSVPLFLGIKFNVAGDLNLNLDIDFGFNTRGLTDPLLNPEDGFFIYDYSGPEVEIDSSVILSVSLGAGIFGSLEGGGIVSGLIDMELVNGATPGRLYLDEFIDLIQTNPFGAFTGSGQIALSFFAALQLLGAEVWRWSSPNIVLGNFSFGGVSDGTDWNLGARTGGSLLLHIGDEAHKRTDPADDLDGFERMSVAMAADGTTVQVQYANANSDAYRYGTFTGISRVNADGGNLGDEIVMAEGLLLRANFAGGDGNDLLAGGDSLDTLSGDAGNDALFGYSGRDSLTGGIGDDLLNGGASADTLDGGGGSDRVSFAQSWGDVRIDFLAGTAFGAHAAGDVLISIENVDGSAFGDEIIGGAIGGQFFGMGGNDTLSSGTGLHLLAGGDGDDSLIGNGSGDTLVGGQGNDTYVVFSTNTIVSDNLLGDIPDVGGMPGRDTVEAWVNYNLAEDSGVEDLTLFNLATAATGNALANILTGNVLGNGLYGGGGNDTLYGGGAADLLAGGLDNDRSYGGTGNDTLFGDDGNDWLYGDENDDALYGGTGNDTLEGGAGADFYSYLTGDTITDAGDDGVDFVWANNSYTIDAGQRLEILSVMSLLGQSWTSAYNAADRIAALRDLIDDHGIATTRATLSLTGGFRDDVLIGYGTGTNTLAGLGGADSLIGDADDTASYAASAAAINIDIARATQIGGDASGDVLSGITRIIGSDFDDIITGSTVSLSGLRVDEAFYGGNGNDLLTGLFGDDSLFGGGGNDSLTGGGDSDSLDGGSGRDTVFGGSGNDILNGGSGNDILYGGTGNDVFYGGTGNDTFHVDAQGDLILETSSALFETNTVVASVSYALAVVAHVDNLQTVDAAATTALDLTGNSRAQEITGNAGANRLDGGGGADTLIGGAGADYYITDGGDTLIEALLQGQDTVESSVSHTLGVNFEELILTGFANLNGTGNSLANRIVGNSGSNRLNGGVGIDTLLGSFGDDVYIIGGLDEIIEFANQGHDRVESSVSYTLAAEVEDLTLTGTAAINGTGNGLANVITGNSADNSLNGGFGRDTMIGGAGNDTYHVNASNEGITELAGQGTDTIITTTTFALKNDVEVEVLTANIGTVTTNALDLTGNSMSQAIIGNAGDNQIDGRLGADTLTGGGGADTFVFSTNLNGLNVDRITDFASGTDKIALDDAIFTGLGSGSFDPLAFVSTTSGQATASFHRIVYNSLSGALWYDADGSGSGARVEIAVLGAGGLAPPPTLTASDFVMV